MPALRPAPLPAPASAPRRDASALPPSAVDTQPRIVEAIVAPGHDGQAELVLRVRFENGAIGSVTLDALFARNLMEHCGVDSANELVGLPCQRLFELMPEPGLV